MRQINEPKIALKKYLKDAVKAVRVLISSAVLFPDLRAATLSCRFGPCPPYRDFRHWYLGFCLRDLRAMFYWDFGVTRRTGGCFRLRLRLLLAVFRSGRSNLRVRDFIFASNVM